MSRSIFFLRHLRTVSMLFLLAMNPQLAAAATSVDSGDGSRPKVGLALSGGGARGAAHIGVIRVLEENNVPIDYIAGTSMGSIVGGLYSSGMDTNEIEAALGSIDWDGVFDDLPPRSDRSYRRKRDDDTYLIKFKPGFNEIVHEIDLFPTFAKIAGGKVPDDRVVDGIDQTDFLLGKQENSNREGLIVYMGNDIFGVKWRNWKIHLKEQDTIFSGTVDYGLARVYNLYKDPGETQNVLFPETWVPKAALGQLGAHVVSLGQEPPIRPGQTDPYEPPK